MKFIRGLQVSINAIADHAVKKKPLLDALPVGNITLLIGQDIKMIQAAVGAFADALLDASPVSSVLLGHIRHSDTL